MPEKGPGTEDDEPSYEYFPLLESLCRKMKPRTLVIDDVVPEHFEDTGIEHALSSSRGVAFRYRDSADAEAIVQTMGNVADLLWQEMLGLVQSVVLADLEAVKICNTAIAALRAEGLRAPPCDWYKPHMDDSPTRALLFYGRVPLNVRLSSKLLLSLAGAYPPDRVTPTLMTEVLGGMVRPSGTLSVQLPREEFKMPYLWRKIVTSICLEVYPRMLVINDVGEKAHVTSLAFSSLGAAIRFGNDVGEPEIWQVLESFYRRYLLSITQDSLHCIIYNYPPEGLTELKRQDTVENAILSKAFSDLHQSFEAKEVKLKVWMEGAKESNVSMEEMGNELMEFMKSA
ncbi:hypothetical protein L202_05176 [Cryptococcus amylolentus CBS 6039]|uniref:Uncharacterized protein n=1 Tax=Cryptococcus amylolentus CBS 6039 TaxID=1295533 RepID=A0A1E3HJI2_9TREE|nr:hypothetical protein L202_05176 [Cryptococcus amylolentus CBS 6039]ODN76509.1 hypothetical protein L202_05176 [Cryptococcus amylolentus CBS 6039]